MDTTAAQLFVVNLREILSASWEAEVPSEYLRLDETDVVDYSLLQADINHLPPADPLSDAFTLIMDQLLNLHLDNMLLGLNEIYKAYLGKINPKNQDRLTHRLISKLKLFFHYMTEKNFPYTEQVWEAMCSMAKPVGLFLVRNGLSPAASLFLEFMSIAGKQAARNDLNTRTLQHVFRVLELAVQEVQWEEMKSLLQNLRQNLEN